ncbi:MAG: hypothetical protein K0S32_3694 [Bacteroidetes bacterium]|nr:hypothetical protein [Bacteroidota bacterium]
MVFNYSFFRAYIKFNKAGFRKELLVSSAASVEKLSMAFTDLYQDKNGIEWHENNKEISILGKFYEVIRVEKGTVNATIFIIKDDKENELFSSFFSKKIKNNYFIFHLAKLVFGMHLNSGFVYDFTLNNDIKRDTPQFIKSFYDSEFHSEIIKPPRFFSLFY